MSDNLDVLRAEIRRFREVQMATTVHLNHYVFGRALRTSRVADIAEAALDWIHAIQVTLDAAEALNAKTRLEQLAAELASKEGAS